MTSKFYTLPESFDKFFVGFDDIFKQMNEVATKTIPNYPPYNIKKTDENTYVIELAVAGFGKQHLEVELEGDKLVIKGNVDQGEDTIDTLYQGLAFRPFTRMFTLNDKVEVANAELINGLLKVYLERITPEENKTKVDIKDGSESSPEFFKGA